MTEKMWDGKPCVKEEKDSYIYKGITNEGKLISLPTERETLNALSEAGGGRYTNHLHKFSFNVKSGDKY